MTSRSYRLVILDVPKSLNAGGAGSRSHWSAAHREKKQWEQRYGEQLMVAGVKRGMSFCEVSVQIAWRHRRRRDSTNYYAPVIKPFADVLVSGGFLVDDTDDFFKVGRFGFIYPEQWPVLARDARGLLPGFMVITLEAEYPSVITKENSPGAQTPGLLKNTNPRKKGTTEGS
jgi:hypothetical protein